MVTCYTLVRSWLSTILQLFSRVLLELGSSCLAFAGKTKGLHWPERQQEAWERRAMSLVHGTNENKVSSVPTQGILRISQKTAYSHLVRNIKIHLR